MQTNKFYMQIHGSNLADYINKAIILPSKYIQNRTDEDIQSQNEEFILLSDGYFEDLTDNQILLEIVLTDEERKSLEAISLNSCSLLKDKVYACEIPLPITRITHIYIESKERIQQYQSTFHIGDVGYLPNDRLKILSKNFKKKLERYSIPSNLRNKTIKWSELSKESKLYPYKLCLFKSNKNREKLLKYDKIMGMFSFMQNTNFYFSKREKSLSNYSKNYFNFLSLLNKDIEAKDISEKQLIFLKKLLQIEKMNTLIERLYTSERIDEDFIKEIAENSDNKDTLYKLFDEMEKIEALEDLKDKQEFFLAYLYINRFDGDMESLKARIIDIDDIGKAEILLAMFGLYYGYSKIRAREEILIEDNIFKNLLIDNREKNIKFIFDSKLDYITVESIYQYTFNGKTSNEGFEYLEYPKQHICIKIKENKYLKNWYTLEKKKYLDVELISLSKNDWTTIIKNKLKKYGKKITPLNAGLFKFLYQNQKKTIKVSMRENEFEESFIYKEEIEEFILKIDDEKKRNQLFDAFRLDGK